MAALIAIYFFFFPFQGQLSTVGYSQVFALVSKILGMHVRVHARVHCQVSFSIYAVFIQQILCNLLTKSRP